MYGEIDTDNAATLLVPFTAHQ